MRLDEPSKVHFHITKRIEEGEGASALRFLGEGIHLDPFVLFDEYTVPHDAFFPMHPHSGFEGFQFLLEGSTRYEDGYGNVGTIGPGGARRFLCTDGFKHSERPQNGLEVKGILLWVRLPKGELEISRTYRQVAPEEIPVRYEGGLKVRTVVGTPSSLGSLVPITMEIMEGSGTLDLELSGPENAFIYVSRGRALAGEMSADPGEGLLFRGPLSSRIAIAHGALAVLARGKAMGGHFVQEGPFVKWT
ncbi:MAG: pirin family protein [Candidatus Thermoplasmatota archaeon]|nr:pirin family protein [Candidatus Thermoplasmatota archaeon]